MVTIPLHLSNELAQRVMPIQDRLPEIIELGLRQFAAVRKAEDRFFPGQAASPGRPRPRRASSPCQRRAAQRKAQHATNADRGRRAAGQRDDHRRTMRKL